MTKSWGANYNLSMHHIFYCCIYIETLAKVLDYELFNKEWFVTGNVNPIYFSDDFEFQDPDVKLSGIESYARGVNKLFDQVLQDG